MIVMEPLQSAQVNSISLKKGNIFIFYALELLPLLIIAPKSTVVLLHSNIPFGIFSISAIIYGLLLSYDHSRVSTLPFTSIFSVLVSLGNGGKTVRFSRKLVFEHNYNFGIMHGGDKKFGYKLFCSFCCLILQSQVYRNQADPVSTAYDTTVSTLAAEYSYGPYPHQTDTSQNYYYPSEYNADNTWNAPEQRKLSS